MARLHFSCGLRVGTSLERTREGGKREGGTEKVNEQSKCATLGKAQVSGGKKFELIDDWRGGEHSSQAGNTGKKQIGEGAGKTAGKGKGTIGRCKTSSTWQRRALPNKSKRQGIAFEQTLKMQEARAKTQLVNTGLSNGDCATKV